MFLSLETLAQEATNKDNQEKMKRGLCSGEMLPGHRFDSRADKSHEIVFSSWLLLRLVVQLHKPLLIALEQRRWKKQSTGFDKFWRRRKVVSDRSSSIMPVCYQNAILEKSFFPSETTKKNNPQPTVVGNVRTFPLHGKPDPACLRLTEEGHTSWDGFNWQTRCHLLLELFLNAKVIIFTDNMKGNRYWFHINSESNSMSY